MLSPEVLLTFFAASLLLGIAPGPDNIFVLTQSAVSGVRAGLVTTLGLVTGLCVHTTAVALGVAAIFQTSPLAFTILKCAGAAYLLYLAWMSFRAGALLAHTPGGGAAFPGYAALYRRGIVMNVTNPKVTLFSAPVLQSGTGRGGRAGADAGHIVHAGYRSGLFLRGRIGRPPGPLVQSLPARPDSGPQGRRAGFRRARRGPPLHRALNARSSRPPLTGPDAAGMNTPFRGYHAEISYIHQ